MSIAIAFAVLSAIVVGLVYWRRRSRRREIERLYRMFQATDMTRMGRPE